MMHVPRFLLVFAAAAAAFSVPAMADTLTLTLLNPVQTIAAGKTAEFDATVTAAAGNTAEIFLNGDSFNVSSPFTLNDNSFFDTFPLSLAPGKSFTGALFTLTNPLPGTGAYSGVFTLLGGANGSSSSSLATAAFSGPANAATPEPSSLLLLATGASTLLAVGRQRFQAGPSA